MKLLLYLHLGCHKRISEITSVTATSRTSWASYMLWLSLLFTFLGSRIYLKLDWDQTWAAWHMPAGEECEPVLRTGPRMGKERAQDTKRTRAPVTHADANNLVIWWRSKNDGAISTWIFTFCYLFRFFLSCKKQRSVQDIAEKRWESYCKKHMDSLWN